MRGHTSRVSLAFAVVLLIAGCSSGDDPNTAADSVTPLDYCAQLAPLWDKDAIANYDEPMSGAERATAVDSLQAAIGALPQGIGLGALTQDQVELLQTGFAVIIALYEDPALADGDPAAAAEAAGLTAEEFEQLSASPEAEGAVDALYSYCQPGGTSTE